MLKSLEIRNYALLDHVNVKFNNGLLILTGETGAGKSIFIDAMGAILGDKTDQSVIRHGADKAVVEAIFSTDESYEVQELLKNLELWYDSGDLILRREILNSGRSRSFVNDTPVTNATLVDIGDFLVDLHGQHEHQSLLRVPEHMKFLDTFGRLQNEVAEIGGLFQDIQTYQQKLDDLKDRGARIKEKKDLVEFQLDEIEKINPRLEEETELEREEKLLHNSEKLFQISNSAYKTLYEEEASVYERLSEVSDQLNDLSKIDERLTAVSSEFESARIIVQETANFIQNYISNFDFNSERLEEIRLRLAELSGLKKKFGGSLENVIQHRDKIRAELETMSNLDSEIASLQKQVVQKKNKYSEKALELSRKRQEAARNLKALIEKNLMELGMEQAVLEIQVSQEEHRDGFVEQNEIKYKAGKKGIDEVQFFLAANPGSPPRPLVKVASGGEISRVMLALKLAQADTDRLPVMIFDEVDSGVSGRIAQAVGRNLQKLSAAHQIICITHLPQIACMGHEHFLVEKFSDSNETRTTVRRLDDEERVLAVAKLLGGEHISQTHLESAKQLIKEG